MYEKMARASNTAKTEKARMAKKVWGSTYKSGITPKLDRLANLAKAVLRIMK
jgi:hypothetical protein